jgi:hypothetical protein
MSCTAILKSGPRKGHPCGAKSSINGFCGRHVVKHVVKSGLGLTPPTVPSVPPTVPKVITVVPKVVPKVVPNVVTKVVPNVVPNVPNTSDVLEYIPISRQPKAKGATYMNYFENMSKYNDDYANVAIFEWVCEVYKTMARLYPQFERDTNSIMSGALMHMISYQDTRYHLSPEIGMKLNFIKKLFEYHIPDHLRLKKPMILYRKAVHAYSPHQILFPIFTSASLSYKFARGWRNTSGCCLYKIIVNPDVNYFPASDMCHDPFQYEIVLPPGELIVEKSEKTDGIMHITGTYRPWTVQQWNKFIIEAPVSKY